MPIASVDLVRPRRIESAHWFADEDEAELGVGASQEAFALTDFGG